MTTTYTPIASQTLTSSATSVTFSSIPQDYRDLVLVVKAIANSSNRFPTYTINGDTGSNYSFVRMNGQVTAGAVSSSGTGTAITVSTGFSTTSGLDVLQFMDFSATDKHKSILMRSGNLGQDWVSASANRWANTAAITSLTINLGGNFAAGSTFSLYGIVA